MPVYNQEAFECVPATDDEKVKQKVVAEIKTKPVFLIFNMF